MNNLPPQTGYSEPLLFNLGNAFYREGRWGMAILNALFGSRRRDSAAEANLQMARARAGLSLPALNPFEKAARVASADTLAWVGSAALALLALGFVAGRLLGPTWRGKARATVLVPGELYPEVPELMLSTHDEQTYGRRVLPASAKACLIKGAGGAELLRIIRRLLVR